MGVVLGVLTKNVIAQWSSIEVYLSVAGVLLVGVVLGILIFRHRGHRAIAQRLTALASRLAVDPRHGDGKGRVSLSYLEEVTGAAQQRGVNRTRSPFAFDVLSIPCRSVSCCATKPAASSFETRKPRTSWPSRYGDAIAAQAVTDVLTDAWSSGVAERTSILGPPRRALTIRATVIDDGRRSLGVLAIIEDVSERRRLEDIRRDFIANVSHELKTPMGALGLLAETLQYERDPSVAHRLAERINNEAFE